MTALTATPPVFLHPLADRNGNPAALLFDADCMQQAGRPLDLPSAVLQELAAA
jgi:hypothetical protein